MINDISGILDRREVIKTLKMLIFAGLMTIIPFFHNQMITGPLVNALLFIAVCLFGARIAILIGLIPSLVALSLGFLPIVSAQIIPFIMVSNALLILIFDIFWKKNYWAGIVAASLGKFIFLSFFSRLVLELSMKEKIAITLANMMSWPQLFTALVGGLLAYVFLRKIKRI